MGRGCPAGLGWPPTGTRLPELQRLGAMCVALDIYWGLWLGLLRLELDNTQGQDTELQVTTLMEENFPGSCRGLGWVLGSPPGLLG